LAWNENGLQRGVLKRDTLSGALKEGVRILLIKKEFFNLGRRIPFRLEFCDLKVDMVALGLE
jgi:hypothetical protein